VLKKAGIVVATAAAGLLAVSPLAFAGDKDDHDNDHDHDGRHKKVKVEDVNHYDDSNKVGRGLINVTDNNVAITSCANTNTDDDTAGLINDVTGVLNFLSVVRTDESNVQVCESGDADAGDSVEQHND
jgi:hypothetical protein